MNTDAMYEVQMHTLEALAQEMAVFHQHYLIEQIINSPDEPGGKLIPKDQRVCRFCGQANNARKFKSKAHFIPQLLGNPYLLSDFECDDCNSLFGKYENDLAYSLGMTRTISAVRGKNKVPHFHSPNDAITARVNDFFGAKSTFIARKDTDVEDFKVDTTTGLTEVFYEKKPYRPLNVYKVLLKIALSIISAEDINHYPRLLAFLRNEAGVVDMSDFAEAYYYTMPADLRMGKPVAILFRKRLWDAKMPAHSLSLYFENFLYVLPIPLYEPDIAQGIYHQHVDIPLPPPMYSNAIDPAAAFHRTIKDLSSPDLFRGKRGSFSFQVAPGIFKTMSSYDPVTGRTQDVVFDPSTITGIHLVDRGTKINLPVSGEHTGAQLKDPPKAD